MMIIGSQEVCFGPAVETTSIVISFAPISGQHLVWLGVVSKNVVQ
jgi:hypothetical protein